MAKLKNLIKRVTSSGNTFDSGVIQQVKATYMGKSVTTQVLHDYGFMSSPPAGSLGICLNPRAEEEDQAAMYFHPKYQKTGLKPGETIVGNFVVEATLYFDENGKAILTLPDALEITCKSLTANISGDAAITVGGNLQADVTGNATANITGDATIQAANLTATLTGNANFTAAAYTFSGPVTFNGAVTAAAGITTAGLASTGSMTSNGVDVGETHMHLPGTYVVGTAAVTGVSGAVSP